jgi:Sec-independent protein translocase protein TatA
MFRLVRRIICLLVTALIVFFVIALWCGGEKFRWFGEKTGGAIRESSEKLGNKADEIRETRDEVADKIKKLTGDKAEPVKKHQVVKHETAVKKTKEPDNAGEEDGNKMPGSFWSTLWEKIKKIKALIKE